MLGTVPKLDPLKYHAMILDALVSLVSKYSSIKLMIVGNRKLNAAHKNNVKR